MCTNTDTVWQGLPIKFLFYSHVCLGWNSNTTNLVYLVCHAAFFTYLSLSTDHLQSIVNLLPCHFIDFILYKYVKWCREQQAPLTDLSPNFGSLFNIIYSNNSFLLLDSSVLVICFHFCNILNILFQLSLSVHNFWA